MGISGNLIKEFRDVRKLVKLSDLNGKCIAIDVSNELYRAVTGMKNVNLLTDKDNNITSHILVMLQNAIKFQKNNIKQIYVFDGKPYNEKKETLIKRQEIKSKAKEKINDINIKKEKIIEDKNKNNEIINDYNIDIYDEGDNIIEVNDIINNDINNDINNLNLETQNQINTFEKIAFSPTQKMFDDIKFMLECLGIDWVQLSYDDCCEAEQYCAYLTKNGIADYAFTSDIDAFMFGATNVIRREQTEKKDKLGNIKKGPNAFYSYNLEEMLNFKELSYDNFISIGIALGTDFSNSIKGIGIKTAFKKFNTIKDKFDDTHKRTYEIFNSSCKYVNTSLEINPNSKNINLLKEWLINEKNFNKDIVNKRLSE